MVKGLDRLEKMTEESNMCEMIKTEEGDDLCSGDWDKQPFVLLLRVIQANGKPLPIGGFTTRAISQMLHDVAGAIPREVIIMNDQEVVMEFKEEVSLMDVSRLYMDCSIGKGNL